MCPVQSVNHVPGLYRIEPQPFRAGLTFGGRPSRPRIHGDFAVSFLSQLVAGKSAPPTTRRGRRDDKGRVVLWGTACDWMERKLHTTPAKRSCLGFCIELTVLMNFDTEGRR